jgi:hypothetical protein
LIRAAVGRLPYLPTRLKLTSERGNSPNLSPASLSTFLVEDKPAIRENLIPAMKEMADVQVVGVAGSEREALGG